MPERERKEREERKKENGKIYTGPSDIELWGSSVCIKEETSTHTPFTPQGDTIC